jgi:hypothetical protein
MVQGGSFLNGFPSTFSPLQAAGFLPMGFAMEYSAAEAESAAPKAKIKPVTNNKMDISDSQDVFCITILLS